MDESISGIVLSLKDVDGTNFNNAFELLKFVLAQCCEIMTICWKAIKSLNSIKIF